MAQAVFVLVYVWAEVRERPCCREEMLYLWLASSSQVCTYMLHATDAMPRMPMLLCLYGNITA